MSTIVQTESDLCHIVAALNENAMTLASRMHLACDAVIVNQCHEDGRNEYTYDGHRIRVVNASERGVGRSRNQGLLLSEAPVTLIGDEDIIYHEGYAETILRAFHEHPEADVLLFNVEQSEGRQTYRNKDFARVRFYSCGRYPAYSIAIRTARQREANVWFSLLFGGGARYMAGEDSLFLTDCLRKGLRIYRTPESIGREIARESTWFEGYTEKFFRDRGALYRALYGGWAPFLGFLYLCKNKGEWLTGRTFSEAWRLLREGMR
ncbi:MAG: glycosyltransferase [Lachnospiraceae bacterium]|nr:glycosyltransferase [Lachnospiraceae bacterium]